MTKILTLSDAGVPSGYGRIHDSLMPRLVKRGYQVQAASLLYDGLLPPQYEGTPLLPYYFVSSLAGHPNWGEQFTALVAAFQPGIVMVIQDAPYAEAVRNAPIDWSKHALIVITPVDGKPVYPQWVSMLKTADGTLSISQFGVDAHREAGIASELCRPGIDPDVFYRLPDDQRLAIRQRLGIAPDAFVLGTVAQNQGRKAIPGMMHGFFKFAQDKPTARYLMNMDPQSPAGWDLMQLCQMNGWDARKIIWRADCDRLGIHEMRERYNVMDAHVVLSHREGFGLPLVEAQACGVVSMAIDWCSGHEICGDGYGVIVKHHEHTEISTWGGALDFFPNYDDMAVKLQGLYDNPTERAAIAERGMKRARTWTWDGSVDNAVKVIERVLSKRRSIVPHTPPVIQLPQIIPPNADGIRPVEQLEAV